MKWGLLYMSKTIKEIKEEFGRTPVESWNALYSEYEGDSRSGVQKLLHSFRKQEEARKQELIRLEEMCRYEKKYQSYDYICGIDEVGRGPLAGPVVAAAVILPKDCQILYINDSKKLSAKKREELYGEIMEKAIAVGIGMAGPQRIDEINILQATYEAMREAVSKLTVRPDLLLNDAVVTIASGNGTREMPLHEFFKGPGKTALETGEMVLKFFVPAPKAHTGASYQKYAIRGDSDITIVGAGARLTLAKDGTVAEARITLASVAPTPLRMFEAEKMLVGSKLDAEAIEKAAELCSTQVSPITDQRATREYRIEMVRVWVRHALEQALERAEA